MVPGLWKTAGKIVYGSNQADKGKVSASLFAGEKARDSSAQMPQNDIVFYADIFDICPYFLCFSSEKQTYFIFVKELWDMHFLLTKLFIKCKIILYTCG